MASDAVSKKINFDNGLAKKINVSATPSIYIGDEKIDFSGTSTDEAFIKLMQEKIDPKLK